MTLGRLKWLAIVLPTLFLTGIWLLLHDVAIELHRFPGILVLFGVTVLAVAMFAFGVFAVVSRLESRIDDPRKVWKLTDMDLKSYRRWYDYSRARDAMRAHLTALAENLRRSIGELP